MAILFVDMDGCLAVWKDASLEEIHQEGYFLGRPAQENLIEAVKILVARGHDVRVLSCVLGNAHAAREKAVWLDRSGLTADLVPRIFVPYGEPKEEYVSGEEGPLILLDDYSMNLRSWKKAGHTGVKFLNGVNGTHGTWDGFVVNGKMSAGEIARQLEGLALTA